MRIDVISFTQNGYLTSKKLKELLHGEYECNLFCASEKVNGENVLKIDQSIYEWSEERFKDKTPIVFVSAMGIAVRAIAPSVKNKLEDIPVIVIDEKGEYVIPVLSGHVGGANEIAKNIADAINAKAVITTATDINNAFAIDMFAKKNNLWIKNKDGIAKVSSKILNKETINIYIESGHLKESKIPEGVNVVTDKNLQIDVYVSEDVKEKNDTEEKDRNDTVEKDRNAEEKLTLVPKDLVLGIGCKKGKSFEEISAFVEEKLKEERLNINQFFAIASIDVKKDEEGLIAFAKANNLLFITYSKDELAEVEGDFDSSDFVMENVGVDNVCERAALKAAGDGGVLILKKQKDEGKTLAIAKREWSVVFDE